MIILRRVSRFFKDHESIIYYTTFVLFILFRLWLIMGVPKMFIYGPHDDLYFAKAAHYLIHGQWLGPYSQMTLIKVPFYAFFLIFSSFTGLPLLLNETIFYGLGCLLLFFAVMPLIKNAWARLALFSLLLFCPASLATIWVLRVYREFVYYSLTLFVTSCAIGLFLRLDQKLSTLLLWSLGLGLSMGAFLITREEGVWIFPIILFLMAACIFLIFKKKMDRKRMRFFLVLIPILLWFIPMLIISSVNYSYYGFFGVSETLDPDFNNALNNLLRIKPDFWLPYQPVTQDTLTKAYAVSPLFGKLKGTIDSQLDAWTGYSDQAIRMKPNWYVNDYLLNGSPIGVGHFMWLFRDAIATNGYYSNGQYPREYLQNLAGELKNACDKKTIECHSESFIPLLGTFRLEQAPLALHFFVDDIYRLLILDNFDSQILPLNINTWPAYQNEFNYFEEFAYNPIDSHDFGNSQNNPQLSDGKADIRLTNLYFKEALMRGFQSIYETLTFPITLIIIIEWLLLLILKKYKKTGQNSFQAAFIGVFVLGLLISRLFLLAVLDAATSVPGLYYSSSNYIFIYILIFLLGYNLINAIGGSIKPQKLN